MAASVQMYPCKFFDLLCNLYSYSYFTTVCDEPGLHPLRFTTLQIDSAGLIGMNVSYNTKNRKNNRLTVRQMDAGKHGGPPHETTGEGLHPGPGPSKKPHPS